MKTQTTEDETRRHGAECQRRLTDLIFSDKVAKSLPFFGCLALSLKRPHTHSLSAGLSAESSDSLSRQWERFKCYLCEKCWQKHARDSGQRIHRATASKIDLLAVAKASLGMPLLHCRICKEH